MVGRPEEYINSKAKQWRTKKMVPVLSNDHEALPIYDLLLKIAGYEPSCVKALEVRFEVDEPLKFKVEFLADHKRIEAAKEDIKKLTEGA